MAIVPDLQIGLWNGWLFMIVFLVQWLAILLIPGHLARRTGDVPEGRTRGYRLVSFLTNALWIVASLYSIFLPFRLGTPWVWVGVLMFGIGLAILVLATISIASTPEGSPFTSGVYRYSCHPGYLSIIVVYLGVSIAAASWIFLLITGLTFLMLQYAAKREEEWCRVRFGDAYRLYMERTQRWIGLPRAAIK